MSYAKYAGTDLAGSISRWSVGAGARVASVGCYGPVRLFCSNVSNQHIQVLGGVGYGVKEETSILCDGVSFRDMVRALARPGSSVPERVRVIGIPNGNPGRGRERPGAVPGRLQPIGIARLILFQLGQVLFRRFGGPRVGWGL